MNRQPEDSLPRIETCLAQSHRTMARAIEWASTLSDLGLHDDLQLLQLEIERISFSLLRDRKYRSRSNSTRAYLYDALRDDRRSSA